MEGFKEEEKKRQGKATRPGQNCEWGRSGQHSIKKLYLTKVKLSVRMVYEVPS